MHKPWAKYNKLPTLPPSKCGRVGYIWSDTHQTLYLYSIRRWAPRAPPSGQFGKWHKVVMVGRLSGL